MTDGVTILMPAYNQERYIAQAVESALAQTYPHWELVIVDDASTDRTPEIAQEYVARDRRVLYWRNERNSGAARSYNVALECGDPAYPYFIALPSDDRWTPTVLAELTAVAQAHPEADLVHCDMQLIDANNDFIQLYSALFDDMPSPGLHRSFALLCRGNYFGHPATLARKRALWQSPLATEPFDPDLVHIHDYYLWVTLMNCGAQAYYLPKPLVQWRKHEGQLTSYANRVKSILEELLLFQDKLRQHIRPEREPDRRQAVLERLERLGPLFLQGGQPQEARQYLAQARALGSGRRLDLTVAEVIARLPVAPALQRGLWASAVRINGALRGTPNDAARYSL